MHVQQQQQQERSLEQRVNTALPTSRSAQPSDDLEQDCLVLSTDQEVLSWIKQRLDEELELIEEAIVLHHFSKQKWRTDCSCSSKNVENMQ